MAKRSNYSFMLTKEEASLINRFSDIDGRNPRELVRHILDVVCMNQLKHENLPYDLKSLYSVRPNKNYHWVIRCTVEQKNNTIAEFNRSGMYNFSCFIRYIVINYIIIFMTLKYNASTDVAIQNVLAGPINHG